MVNMRFSTSVPLALICQISTHCFALNIPVERASTDGCTYQPAPNPPSTRICGRQGTLDPVKVAQLGSNTTTPTSDACRDLCLANTQCISFSYSTIKTCTFYNKRIIDQGYKSSTSSNSLTFWNRKCFKKVCPAPPACSTGLSKCGDVCVNLTSDNANCGTCGNACGMDQTCSSGQCVCSDSTKKLCRGRCINVIGDPQNCGSCGNVCEGLFDTCFTDACGYNGAPFQIQVTNTGNASYEGKRMAALPQFNSDDPATSFVIQSNNTFTVRTLTLDTTDGSISTPGGSYTLKSIRSLVARGGDFALAPYAKLAMVSDDPQNTYSPVSCELAPDAVITCGTSSSYMSDSRPYLELGYAYEKYPATAADGTHPDFGDAAAYLEDTGRGDNFNIEIKHFTWTAIPVPYH